MTSTISHPNVVATYDYRVVHLAPTPPGAGLGLSSNSRVLQVSDEYHQTMISICMIQYTYCTSGTVYSMGWYSIFHMLVMK